MIFPRRIADCSWDGMIGKYLLERTDLEILLVVKPQ